jgi:hypothetical protein
MSLTWTLQDRIRFARCDDSLTGLVLYAIVECLPDGDAWDWSVWLPDDPKRIKYGVARSASEAVAAADVAAETCLRESVNGSTWLWHEARDNPPG